MKKRLFQLFVVGAAVFAGALPALADHGNADVASPNMLHVAADPTPAAARPTLNTDLAFWGNVAAAGNFSGFRLFDITKPENPVLLTSVACNGGQGDVSFYKAKNRLLMFVSVDTPQTRRGPNPGEKDCPGSANTAATTPECGTQVPVTAPCHWEGIRIWDVTDPVAPRFVTAVYTDCGSHTHTTIPDSDDHRAIIYVSSYPLAATGLGPRCGPPNDHPDPRATRMPHGKISIIEVPDAAPATAHVLKEQPLHLDTVPSVGEDESLVDAVGCHDITAFFDANQAPEGGNTLPKPQFAAAACLTEGQIWDIRDPANPRTLDEDGHSHIRNEAIEVWHSAAWTWDGQVILFGDEHGAGQAPGCGGEEDTSGNIWFYKQVPPPVTPPLLGRYHIPRNQFADVLAPQPQECTLHNFNVIPINDNEAYIGVSSAYKGGTTVFDFSRLMPHKSPLPVFDEFTAPVVAEEIAFYDSHSTDQNGHDDVWSSYWYNDFIYTNSGLNAIRNTPYVNRGFEVFKLLTEPATCPETETCNAKQFTARKFHHMNPQTQEGFETLDGGGKKGG